MPPAPASDDRRDTYRVELPPGVAFVRSPVGTLALRDLSGGGGAVILPDGPGSPLTMLPARVSLPGAEPFTAELQVVRVTREAQALRLGARFRGLGAEALRALADFLAREVRRRRDDPARLTAEETPVVVGNPALVAATLKRHALRARRLLVALDGKIRLPLRLRIDAIVREDGPPRLRARILGSRAGLERDRAYTFLLPGASAMCVFSSRVLALEEDAAILALPTELKQTGFRASSRVELAPERRLRVSLTDPRGSGQVVDGAVRDLGLGGLSLELERQRVVLFPGDRLRGLALHLPDGTILADAVVRSLLPGEPGGSTACGIELVEFADPRDAARWRRFAFGAVHPRLTPLDVTQAEASWRILEASRYVALWTPDEDRAHLRRRYLGAWSGADEAVGRAFVIEGERGPAGLSAGNLVYPGTWMLHHLAIGEEQPTPAANQRALTYAHELISGLLGSLRGGSALEHFVIYLEAGKRWNDRLYGEFAARSYGADRLLYSRFEVLRRATADPRGTEPEPGAPEIVPATPALWEALAARAAATLSPLERAAYALDGPQIDLAAFTEACARVGYERRRAAYVALDDRGDGACDGRPLAAIVVETGDEGANVFGLLNACWLVPLGDRPLDAGTARALLRRAIAHYRAAGKRTFLLFAPAREGGEDGAPEAPPAGFADPLARASSPLGFEPVSHAVRWLAHRDVIPAWTAYLDELLRGLGATS